MRHVVGPFAGAGDQVPLPAAELGHRLRLRQLAPFAAQSVVGLLAVGDVSGHAAHGEDLAGRVPERELDREVGAVEDDLLDLERSATVEDLPVVSVYEVGDLLRPQLVVGPAEDALLAHSPALLELAVDQQIAALGVL